MRKSSSVLPTLLMFGGAALLLSNSNKGRASSARPSGGGGSTTGSRVENPWTVLPAAAQIELDPSRQYAAVITVPGPVAAMATDGMVQSNLNERAEWQSIQVWSDPADIPETVRKAFAASDLKQQPGHFFIFGRPATRKSLSTEFVTHAYVRPARPEE